MGTDNTTGRRTPAYLITRENAEALIGPLPLTAPPVIGDGYLRNGTISKHRPGPGGIDGGSDFS